MARIAPAHPAADAPTVRMLSVVSNKNKEYSFMWKLGFIGIFGLLGLLGLKEGYEALYGLYGLFGFYGFFGLQSKDKDK